MVLALDPILHLEIPLSNGSMAQNVIIFRVDVNSSVHIDNKRKEILILEKGPKQVLR